MKITKRNGTKQAFMPNKLLNRIKESSKDLKVNPDKLFKDVIPSIYDDMSTTEIDEIISYAAADKILEHPDYSVLGGRILMSRQSKLVGRPLQPVDETYDFFAATTFLTKYSTKDSNKSPIELPSDMYERVSNFLSDSPEEKEEIHEELVNKRINFATPIYTNADVENRGGMISCKIGRAHV